MPQNCLISSLFILSNYEDGVQLQNLVAIVNRFSHSNNTKNIQLSKRLASFITLLYFRLLVKITFIQYIIFDYLKKTLTKYRQID